MLVLSRKVHEGIKIAVPKWAADQEIEIVLIGVSRGKAKIGLIAPRNISILRTEVSYADAPKYELTKETL